MQKLIAQKDIKDLFELIKRLVAQFYSQQPSIKRRGRPATYPAEIILFAIILKQHLNVSYRTIEHILKDILGYSPDFSTLFYRFKRLDTKLVSFVLSETAETCQKLPRTEEYRMMVTDSTGFGYKNT